MKKNFYITTTAPYVNADPHIGFALELVQADVIARFKKSQGFDVAFGFGTDEHGVKIYRKALERKKDPQEYCDEYAKKFDSLTKALSLNVTHFIRTTDARHVQSAQEFWMRCYRNGDIYKKNYRVKYCIGCELEKTDSELVDNACPIHPNLEIEIYEEENYFFRFSNYQNKLLELYRNNPRFVMPKNRLLEIETFVKNGLQDFSISRLKNKMPWGIDVPNDPDHVMYVWFDALVFYVSNIHWPLDEHKFRTWWPVVQIAGKDNLRQQSAIWQAMLMSAGLTPSREILIHGFITSNGQKMSKSLGNVVDPFELINTYGVDAVRYYLLHEIPVFDDGDFSTERMKEIYNSDLANELGNLVSRITTLGEKDGLILDVEKNKALDPVYADLLDKYEFNTVLTKIWEKVKNMNKKINDFEPWHKTPESRKEFLVSMLQDLHSLAQNLLFFLPDASDKIISATNGPIEKTTPLFPRIT